MKGALKNLGGDVVTWGEFQTFLFMAANLVNEQPIDEFKVVKTLWSTSAPTLLLSWTSPKGDPGDFQFEGYLYKRLQHKVSIFWKKWSELVGPNLFIRSKRHMKQRNVMVGDVVWLADQNVLRGRTGQSCQCKS